MRACKFSGSDVERVGHAIIIAGRGGEIEYANAMARKTFGDPPVFGAGETEPARQALSGEPLHEVEFLFHNHLHRDGLWLSVTSVPLRDGHGDVAGAVAVFRDVTG
jgi:PAS domain-containing protein